MATAIKFIDEKGIPRFFHIAPNTWDEMTVEMPSWLESILCEDTFSITNLISTIQKEFPDWTFESKQIDIENLF